MIDNRESQPDGPTSKDLNPVDWHRFGGEDNVARPLIKQKKITTWVGKRRKLCGFENFRAMPRDPG
jgi:hypothetical protein